MIAKKRGHKVACCAVARKLAVTLHAMWRDGSEYGEPLSSTNGQSRRQKLALDKAI